MCGKFQTTVFACAVTGAGAVVPAATRASSRYGEDLHVRSFRGRLDELGHEAAARNARPCGAGRRRSPRPCDAGHHQLEIAHVLQARLRAGGVLEVVPDDGHGVDALLLEGDGVEHTARRAGPSEPDADDGHLRGRRLVDEGGGEGAVPDGFTNRCTLAPNRSIRSVSRRVVNGMSRLSSTSATLTPWSAGGRFFGGRAAARRARRGSGIPGSLSGSGRGSPA